MSEQSPSSQTSAIEMMFDRGRRGGVADLQKKVALVAAGKGAEDGTGSENLVALLERVRGAARYIRDVEDRAQDQDRRVQELLAEVQADMQAARAQVQAAEQRSRDIQAQAAAAIKAAEERARIAEEKASVAETWLHRISEAIHAEFVADRPDAQAAGSEIGHAAVA